jgi:hypothetical protein
MPRRMNTSATRVILKSCEICCSSNIMSAPYPVGLVTSCGGCGARFAYYFRADGALLDYPRGWGAIVGVVQELEAVEKADPGSLAPDVSENLFRLHSGFYYVFQAANGTLRRARLGSAEFGTNQPRPAGLPEMISWYHFWNVDVCPCHPARNTKA